MKMDRGGRTLEDYRQLYWDGQKRIAELDEENQRLKDSVKAIRKLPRYSRYGVWDDTTDDNSCRWILVDQLEAKLTEKPE